MMAGRQRKNPAQRFVVGSPMQRMLALQKHSRKKPRKKIPQKTSRSSSAQNPPADPLALITGIPQEIVLHHIIPRLPFYMRAQMLGLSRAWRSALQDSSAARSRELLTNTGLVYLQVAMNSVQFELLDVSRRTWHQMPPPLADWMQCWSGVDQMLYTQSFGFYSKLDISAGCWRWESSSREEVLSKLRLEIDEYKIFGGRYVQKWASSDPCTQLVDLPRRLGCYKGERVVGVACDGDSLYAAVHRDMRLSTRCSLWRGDGVSSAGDISFLKWSKLVEMDVAKNAKVYFLAFACC